MVMYTVLFRTFMVLNICQAKLANASKHYGLVALIFYCKTKSDLLVQIQNHIDYIENHQRFANLSTKLIFL